MRWETRAKCGRKRYEYKTMREREKESNKTLNEEKESEDTFAISWFGSRKKRWIKKCLSMRKVAHEKYKDINCY